MDHLNVTNDAFDESAASIPAPQPQTENNSESAPVADANTVVQSVAQSDIPNTTMGHAFSNAIPKLSKNAHFSPRPQRLDQLSTDASGQLVVISDRPNKALAKFVESVKESTIPSVVTIRGVYGKTDGRTCLWDEGGAVPVGDGVEGASITIAAPDGSRLIARHVCAETGAVNGRHALYQVDLGYYVALAHAVAEDDYECAVYRITDICGFISTKGDYHRPQYTCTQECVFIDGEMSKYEDGTYNQDTIFSADHPFIKAAVKSAITQYSKSPTYICPYVEAFYDHNDTISMTMDATLIEGRKEFNTLDEAYAAADAELIEMYNSVAGQTDLKVVLTTLATYRESTNDVAVVLLGTIYDFATKSSAIGRGRRVFCHYVILKEGNNLRYIDSETEVEFDKVVTCLKRLPDYTQPISQARVCNTPY